MKLICILPCSNEKRRDNEWLTVYDLDASMNAAIWIYMLGQCTVSNSGELKAILLVPQLNVHLNFHTCRRKKLHRVVQTTKDSRRTIMRNKHFKTCHRTSRNKKWPNSLNPNPALLRLGSFGEHFLIQKHQI